jgi:hypothetical protein
MEGCFQTDIQGIQMAKKYKFEVEADTGPAKDDLSKITGQLNDISTTAGKAGSQLGSVGKMTPGLVKGFKGLGVAVKAAFAATGIGAVISIFELFKSNQALMDAFNTVTTAIKITFRDIFDLVKPLADAIGKLFTDPVQGIKDLGKLIKDYVINYFNQAWDIVKNLGGAIANLVTGDWEGLKANLKEIGTSVGDAILGNEGASEKMLNNIVKAVVEASKLTQMLNKVTIAEAELEKLREKGDLRLEKLRQIRDDESKSLTDRIAANDELGKALEDQIVKELQLAQLKTQAAKLQWEAEVSIENQAAYIRAQAGEIAVQNRLESQRSEMLMNTNALLREQNDIAKSKKAAVQEVADIESQADRLRLKSIEDLLQFDLNAIETKRKAQVDSINEWLALNQSETAARQEQLNQLAIIEAQANLDKLTKNQEYLDAKAAQDKEANDKQITRIQAYHKKMIEEKKAEADMEKRIEDLKYAIVNSILDTSSKVFSENAEVQKGISIAQATISTYQGAASALAQPTPPYLNIIMMIAVIAAGLANVATIIKTKIPGKGGGGGGSGAGGSARQPGTFSMVKPLNQQITTALDKQEPQKAYVTQGDIESSAELDRNIKANARG